MAAGTRPVDCRFDLLDPGRGRELYLREHIPGASFLDLDRDLSDLTRAPAAGRHPLPGPEEFAGAAGRAGIGDGVHVLAYDDGSCGGAARLWWLLRHFGHDAVEILPGGIAAWDGLLAAGPEDVAPATFVPRPRAGDTMDADELASRLGDPRLAIVDARAPARFAGLEIEGPAGRLDPVLGRIPGAVNVPHDRAAPPAEVLEAEEIVVYCGSGVTACSVLHALALAGRGDARLYPGSWSEWCRRGLPVERDPPGA